MAEQQTIKYAPQWTNMTVDNVIFHTNNVVGNFNYLLNVPAYKPIVKFLRNCHLYNAFTNCPLVVYQNFLKEFWSTVVAFDPFPSTDEPEKRPLKEFLIKVTWDKDLGGNIPPADMEPIHTPVVDPSRTGAKYQVDGTQSTRLSLSALWEECKKESNEEEVLVAGDDIDEDIQADDEVRTPSPKQDQPEPSHV
ncbi:hypothetical protein Tco_1337061 [Tanacetum coccineum]